MSTLAVQDQHRGQRSRAGSPPGTGITQHMIPAKLCSVAGWAWIFLWGFFSGLFFVGFFFPLFPFIVFCGRAGFLLSVSEVCSSDEKD